MYPVNMIEKNTYNVFEKQIRNMIPKSKGKKIAVWGASIRGMIAGMILEKNGIRDFIFVDSDENKHNKMVNGHIIRCYEETDPSDFFYIVSMENNKEVIRILSSCQQTAGNYLALHSSDSEDILTELNRELSEYSLVLGASCLHILPADEVEADDLAQMIKKRSLCSVKALGITCLQIRHLYYLLCMELEKNNSKIKNVIIALSWENLTSYHHLLPRSQKIELLDLLIERSENESGIAYEMKEYKQTALERVKNYSLEALHSVSLFSEGECRIAKRKEYIDNSTLEPLDCGSEPIIYFEKLLALLADYQKRAVVIIEPINCSLCFENDRENNMEIYNNKIRYIKNLTLKYGMEFSDASSILDDSMILSNFTANEGLYNSGRTIMANYIAEIINNEQRKE